MSDGMTQEQRLASYALTMGDRVEVELLVATTVTGAPPGIIVPRIVEGIVAGGTPNVLLIGTRHHDARIPWHAIALIRPANAPIAHPATI